MLIAFTGYSQNDTKTPDTVKVSFEVAKKINLDLLDYDRLIKGKVEQNLSQCLRIKQEKDSLIEYLRFKEFLADQERALYQEQTTLLKTQLKTSRKRNGNGWIWAVTGIAVGITTGVLVTN